MAQRIARILGAATLMLAAGSCGGNDAPPGATPAPTSERTTSPNPTAAATPTAAPTATATPHPVSEFNGVFTTPGLREQSEPRPLIPGVESPFAAHDGQSVVLYDTESGTARDLGPGMLGTFTEDGQYMAWTDANGQLWYIELPDGEPVTLGPGGGLFAIAGAVIGVNSPVAKGRWDLATETFTEGGLPGNGAVRSEQGTYVLWRDFSSGQGVEVVVQEGGERLLRFDGVIDASFAAAGELALATDERGGLSNLFLLRIETAEVEFVATAGARLGYVPFVANERWAVWTDDLCGHVLRGPENQGTTKVLERTTGRTFDLGEALFPEGFTPDGRLRVGSNFGALALIDLDSWSYDILLPEGNVDVHWSPDYRYASRGLTVGHGGVCSF
jgi:hypothetical protein